jgi:electron transfer flavoprotein beta subunit
VIAVAPPADEPGLARISGGARAVRAWDDVLNDADYDGLARTLAATCRYVGFDVVVCGDRAARGALGAVGPATAEHLGVPHLSGVVDASWHDDGRLALTRREDGGVRRFLCAAPLVIAARPPQPHGPPAAARPADAPAVEAFTLEALGLRPEELRPRRTLLGELVARPAITKVIAHGAAALVDGLRAAGAL